MIYTEIQKGFFVMKRILVLFLAFAMLLAFAACENAPDASSDNSASADKSGEAAEKTMDMVAEADAIIEKYALEGGERFSSSSSEGANPLDEDLIFDFFGEADFSQVEGYELYIDQTKPLKPCEFGIFKLKDGADAETFILFLKARIDENIALSKSYPNMDTEPLKTAKFTHKGNYVWYCAVKGGNDDINTTLEGKLS